ncbi:DUF4440 domain-containing protein [Gemmatimonas sp.]|uniref:YybH family protein n=1 Tax=Gemmatimonas sp. TaxID=1962908 RepID=UPI00333E567C
MRRELLVVGVVMGLSACNGGSEAAKTDSASAPAVAVAATADPVAVRAAIDSANKRGAQGFNTGSADAMIANYADDAVVMMPGMKVMVGKAAIDAGMKGMFQSMDMKNFMQATTDVVVEGDVAIESGTMTLEAGPKGAKLAVDTIKYLTVWKKQGDGSWKIIRDINNTDIAPKM